MGFYKVIGKFANYLLIKSTQPQHKNDTSTLKAFFKTNIRIYVFWYGRVAIENVIIKDLVEHYGL